MWICGGITIDEDGMRGYTTSDGSGGGGDNRGGVHR